MSCACCRSVMALPWRGSASVNGTLSGSRVGRCGDPALLVSLLLILLSAGVSLLLALAWTLRTAATLSQSQRQFGYILVPGKRLLAGAADVEFSARLALAARLWRQQPVPILLSGGCCDGSGVSEARAGLAILQAQGVAPNSVVLDETAAHSYDNLAVFRSQLCRLAPGVVVSNRYHLPRLLLIAGDLGVVAGRDIDALPVEPAIRVNPASWPRWLAEGFYNHWFVVARWLRRLSPPGASG